MSLNKGPMYLARIWCLAKFLSKPDKAHMCTDSLKIEAIQVEYNTSSDVAQPLRHPRKYRHHVETSV